MRIGLLYCVRRLWRGDKVKIRFAGGEGRGVTLRIWFWAGVFRGGSEWGCNLVGIFLCCFVVKKGFFFLNGIKVFKEVFVCYLWVSYFLRY